MGETKTIEVRGDHPVSVRIVTRGDEFGRLVEIAHTAGRTPPTYNSELPSVEIQQGEYFGWHLLEDIVADRCTQKFNVIFPPEIVGEILQFCRQQQAVL